jgi:Flp pilus assembly protein TadG
MHVRGSMNRQRSWARRLLAPAIRRSRSLARDEKGAVAVEFAILAIPFFMLIFAIIETSMTFFAQQILESALQDATRQIRTGQSQTATPAWNKTEFRKAICDSTFGLFECTSNPSTDRLRINVVPVTTFDAAATKVAKPIDSKCTAASTNPTDCAWQLAEDFNDGKGSDVIIAQVFYKWPTIINLPWFSLADQAGNNRLLSAVRVFKNEPF